VLDAATLAATFSASLQSWELLKPVKSTQEEAMLRWINVSAPVFRGFQSNHVLANAVGLFAARGEAVSFVVFLADRR
jgi:hypothetical protein